jgi:F-type H+-transporting ATPase subunit b
MLEQLQHNTTLWVAFAFAIFLVIFAKFAVKPILSALDKKIAEIKTDIETADRLKHEAAALLADFQKKQQEAQASAAQIIEQAKASAAGVQKAAEKELAETMARRESQLADRLKRMEDKAIADIQNHAAELAMQATREIVAKTLDDKKLIDNAIQSVGKSFN